MHLISQKGINYSDLVPQDTTLLTVAEKAGERRLIALTGEGRSAYSGPWAMPLLANLSHLVTLHLSCPLVEIPPLPLSLRTLSLYRCHLGSEASALDITSINEVAEFTISHCSGAFKISLPRHSHLRKFTCSFNALEQGGAKDDFFLSFPETLMTVDFRGLAITDATIKRLPEQLSSLTLKECPNVTASKARLEALFTSCIFKLGEKKNGEESQAAVFLRKLSERVIGQEEAVQRTYARIVPLLQGGKNEQKRPAAILLFVGPTGVGKTELAQAIAETTNRPFERFDMTAYQEEFQVTRLIGSPPGYVGSDKGGALTNSALANPNAVILFDELEKAHRDVIQALLGLLDKGVMNSAHGESVDFTQTVIVMTSNLASREIAALDWRNSERASVEAKELVSVRLRETVSPEFVGRLDEIIAFRPINSAFLKEILLANAEKIVRSASQQYGITLSIDPLVIDYLIRSADPATGVRAPLKALQNQVASLLSEGKLNAVFEKGERVAIRLVDDKIKIRVFVNQE